MGLPRLGGQGGKGGDVWVVASKNMTLKRIKDKYPEKRFLGEAGANSRSEYLLLFMVIVIMGSRPHELLFYVFLKHFV